MTEKCVFCNGTGKEYGFDGCVWCENTGLLDVKRDASGSMVGVALATADAINHGTGVMQVSAEGVEHVPLADVLVDLKPFRLLPYGTKFRYRGTTDVWVRTEHNVIAEWPCRIWSADGSPRSSLCCFCHLDGDEDNPDGLDTLVEVVDQDSELAALREELAKWQGIAGRRTAERTEFMNQRDDAQQRLAAAEKRNLEASAILETIYNDSEMLCAVTMEVARRTREFLTKPTESGASHVDCGQCPNITDGCLGTCQRSKP